MMEAFLDIIEQLVLAISPHTWAHVAQFPFLFLKDPKASVFDACLFEANAQEAYGILWISFEGTSDLFLMPFKLARYQEDADLISLFPWSLRDASLDHNFYEAWRKSQKSKNPIRTKKKGSLLHIKTTGDPSFISVGVWNDTRNTCVRLDFQIVHKLIRVLEKDSPKSIEVSFLSYLSTQNIFTNYAKLISIFEYNCQDTIKSHAAIAVRYIQNNGTLYPYFTSLFSKFLFPSKFKHNSSKESWNECLDLTESLARMLSDFHKAMALAPRNSELAPEHTTEEPKQQWIQQVFECAQKRLAQTLNLKNHYPEYESLFHALPDFLENQKQIIENIPNIGLRIKAHGNLHLGLILRSDSNLVLVDYEADPLDSPKYRRLKQSCLKDAASLIASIRFAWYFSELKYLEKSDLQNKVHLKKIEDHFFKFYYNNIEETVSFSQLKPDSKEISHKIFEFYLLIRILKEISREQQETSPFIRVWLNILTDIIIK